MIQHAIQPTNTRPRPVSKRLTMLVVLQSALDGMQNPSVIQRLGEDVDAESLENGDWHLNVVFEVEDYEVRFLKSVGWRKSHENFALQWVTGILNLAYG